MSSITFEPTKKMKLTKPSSYSILNFWKTLKNWVYYCPSYKFGGYYHGAGKNLNVDTHNNGFLFTIIFLVVIYTLDKKKLEVLSTFYNWNEFSLESLKKIILISSSLKFMKISWFVVNSRVHLLIM